MKFTIDDFQHTADFIQQYAAIQPRVGIVLGSGLGPLADEVQDPTQIPYHDIPNFPKGSVKGHAGRVVMGMLYDNPVMVMQGRAHFYEGIMMDDIAFPIRVMQVMGIEILIVTNAAGGINTGFSQGDIMVIRDHINFPGLAGNNPLMGKNDDRLGPRFTPLTRAYDQDLIAIAQNTAQRLDIGLHRGVYCAVSGPAFETPAEIRMLRTLGADAVGMSTVHEVLTANHAGMRVLGFSSITNVAIDDEMAEDTVSHQEVIDTGKIIVPRLLSILQGVLTDIAQT